MSAGSAEFVHSKEDTLLVVSEHGLYLNHVLEELKADRDIVLAAVNNNGYSLRYASQSLRADSDIVLAAVKQQSFALEYASEELKSDFAFNNRCVFIAPDASIMYQIT